MIWPDLILPPINLKVLMSAYDFHNQSKRQKLYKKSKGSTSINRKSRKALQFENELGRIRKWK